MTTTARATTNAIFQVIGATVSTIPAAVAVGPIWSHIAGYVCEMQILYKSR